MNSSSKRKRAHPACDDGCGSQQGHLRRGEGQRSPSTVQSTKRTSTKTKQRSDEHSTSCSAKSGDTERASEKRCESGSGESCESERASASLSRECSKRAHLQSDR